MASVNKVHLLGNVGKDPEIRYMASGEAATRVSLATTSKYKNKAGEAVEDTQWHSVSFFGRMAEIVGEYVKKGSPIYVEGRLKYGKYTDKDGVERYSTDIVASELQLLGSRPDGDQRQQPQQQRPAPQQGYQQQPQRQAPRPAPQPQRPAAPAYQAPASTFDDMDDVPF